MSTRKRKRKITEDAEDLDERRTAANTMVSETPCFGILKPDGISQMLDGNRSFPDDSHGIPETFEFMSSP